MLHTPTDARKLRVEHMINIHFLRSGIFVACPLFVVTCTQYLSRAIVCCHVLTVCVTCLLIVVTCTLYVSRVYCLLSRANCICHAFFCCHVLTVCVTCLLFVFTCTLYLSRVFVYCYVLSAHCICHLFLFFVTCSLLSQMYQACLCDLFKFLTHFKIFFIMV